MTQQAMRATITYALDDVGRKALLIAGGDGKAEQSATIEIAPGDVDLMDLTSDGSLSADARRGTVQDWSGWSLYYFSAPPTDGELIDFLRTRKVQRAEGEAEQKAKSEAATALARDKAILELRQALAAGTIIEPSQTLNADDPECGPDVARMLALAAAERDRKAGAEARLKAIKAVASIPYSYGVAPLADGTCQFTCPTSSGDSPWAKHLQSVDSGARNGYAFEGPWLRVGSEEVLTAGELVICGSKSWSGSKRRGEWQYNKELYIVTAAGLIKIADDDECRATAVKKLAQEVGERLKKSLNYRAKIAREKAAALQAFDRTLYAGELAEIDKRVSAWQVVAAECEKALSVPMSDEAITDIDSAAAAIVAAGYKALAKIHHPDAGMTGSDATMALLSGARAQLRDILKLAGVK